MAELKAAEPATARPQVGQPLAERRELIVGATTDSYPYGYIDEMGQWTGFGGDLLNAVARVMDLPIRRVVEPGREMQQHFREGRFDFLQSLSQTPEREEFADFSVPFLTLQGAVFVQKRDNPIRKFSDLDGRKFAIVGAGSIAEKFLRDHHLQVERVLVGSIEEGLRLVDTGECAGVFASRLTALSVMEHSGYHNLVMLGQPLNDYDIRHCYAVHKGDAQLLARLNEGLAILHHTGEFDEIYNKWFGRFTSPLISRQQVLVYAAAAFALAFLLALWGLQRQRALRRRVARQAAELAGQQALLRTLYDNIPLAMCVLEAAKDGFIVLAINRQAEAYFGLTNAQVVDRPLGSLAPETDWSRQLSEVARLGAQGRALVREERRLASLRKRIIFTLVPMTPTETGEARYCVLAEDVTDRRKLDEEIAQSRKLRAVGELVGGIAHEFNNLLTPIMLKVGEIQLDWSHDERLIAESRLISDSVQRAAELTRRLLTFGRKTDLHREQVHLSTIVDSCFSLLRLTMERRIVWQQDVPVTLPPIYFSATDLNQIILNLAINARDTLVEKLAVRPGEWTPTIRIEAQLLPVHAIGHADGTPSSRQVLGWQRVTVRDNGMGMTPEVRERLFEPFFTTKDVGKGTGLGLATVWHLVSEVSGRIEVESAPGEGTAFHVYLPMLPAPPPAPAAPPPSVHPFESGAHIFLAEDDALVAEAITMALARAGHRLTHHADGASAWSHLQKNVAAYDLLILDVNMPGLDGIELAQRVRRTLGYAGHIIIASGRLSSEDLRQVSEAGATVLNKPFTVDELLGAVRHSLPASH